jgi:hypothetical protein
MSQRSSPRTAPIREQWLRPGVRAALGLGVLASTALAQSAPPGEGPALTGARITQADILAGGMTLKQIRNHGMRIFSTNFNKLDGYGDGPLNPLDTTSPGGRPTLQDNGTFLRVNGLDAQSCMECHSVGSSTTAPFRFAIGGVGGSNNNAMFETRDIDVDDSDGNGFAAFNGRYINPPFLFGSGGIELAAREMTAELQALKNLAAALPDQPISLVAKGVSFGTLLYSSGLADFDTSGVVGVDEDLVVRPFGRKGEFPTVRQFDLGALEFHMGMQPAEVVGAGLDGDGDGVVNEILEGEVSALHVFNTNLEPPFIGPNPDLGRAALLFSSVGCADCHRPILDTTSSVLTYSSPEVDTDPLANVYLASDLRTGPTAFPPSPGGGIRVVCFSDLKRHDMGPGLAESFGSELDSQFVTARLWGIADTAPYLHDGRALTLTDAILMHGGEAQAARDNFASLGAADRVTLLEGLRSLRTPLTPAKGLVSPQ